MIREVTDARLLGRGGAAFPTGAKWKAVADQSVRPHYVICNADESEPGTFKDRVVMEQDPFAVLEALTIAGFATGRRPRATSTSAGSTLSPRERLEQRDRGGATPRAAWAMTCWARLRVRCRAAARRGRVHLRRGDRAVRLDRGQARRASEQAPLPGDLGLFGKPTAINNVETLMNVLPILTLGAEMYARIGTEGSTGHRLFCLCGHVELPGVYEFPHGITLGEAIDAAGGVRGGGGP